MLLASLLLAVYTAVDNVPAAVGETAFAVAHGPAAVSLPAFAYAGILAVAGVIAVANNVFCVARVPGLAGFLSVTRVLAIAGISFFVGFTMLLASSSSCCWHHYGVGIPNVAGVLDALFSCIRHRSPCCCTTVVN